MSSKKERILNTVGVVAMLISCGAFSLISPTQSWSAAAILVAVGFLALGILFLIVRQSRSLQAGAPTNTQLQKMPPAIIHSGRDDRTHQLIREFAKRMHYEFHS